MESLSDSERYTKRVGAGSPLDIAFMLLASRIIRSSGQHMSKRSLPLVILHEFDSFLLDARAGSSHFVGAS